MEGVSGRKRYLKALEALGKVFGPGGSRRSLQVLEVMEAANVLPNPGTLLSVVTLIVEQRLNLGHGPLHQVVEARVVVEEPHARRAGGARALGQGSADSRSDAVSEADTVIDPAPTGSISSV